MPDVITMPSAVEHERVLLASILSGYDTDNVAESLQESDWYPDAHKAIWRAIWVLMQEHSPIDVVTVTDMLERSGGMAEVESLGGPAYLVRLVSDEPSTHNTRYYAERVRGFAVRRQVIMAAHEIQKMATDENIDHTDLLDDFQARAFSIRSGDLETAAVKTVHDGVPVMIERLKRAMSGETGGVSSGMKSLDKYLPGLFPGELIVLAGRPGMGKTALALNIMANLAKSNGVGLVFNLEMLHDQLTTRVFCSENNLSFYRIRSGLFDQKEFEEVERRRDTLKRWRFYVDDYTGTSVMRIARVARMLKAAHGKLDLIVIDYLQLLKPPKMRGNREQEVAAMSRALKMLALELQVPIMILSQLNREIDKRENKIPLLSDLRESGSIEQDADVVVFCYRPEVYKRTPENEGLAQIFVGKQRNGPIGTADMIFDKRTMTFRDKEESDVRAGFWPDD